MKWLIELIEYIKKFFITIFGGFHIAEGSEIMEKVHVDLFDRIIFIVVASMLLLSIWMPHIIQSESKKHKLLAEWIIHTLIVGAIIYQAVESENFIRGATIIMIYALYEISKILFLGDDDK